jgi:hypothetical protein
MKRAQPSERLEGFHGQLEIFHGELLKHNPIAHTSLKYLWRSSIIVEMKQLEGIHGELVNHNPATST